MLMGAAIGAVVGLIIYLVQQQQKKKQDANTLDSEVKDTTNKSE